MAVDTELSRALAARIPSRRKECWRNAIMALATGEEELAARLEGAVYVEGWVLQAAIGIPIPHGWLELPGGTVVEPTLCLLDGDEALQGARYVAGARWPAEEALKLAVRKGGTLPLHERNHFALTRTPTWLAAMREAYGPLFAVPGFDGVDDDEGEGEEE